MNLANSDSVHQHLEQLLLEKEVVEGVYHIEEVYLYLQRRQRVVEDSLERQDVEAVCYCILETEAEVALKEAYQEYHHTK